MSEYSSKKGKVAITPPTSPTSTSGFSFKQNGYHNNAFRHSQRSVSESSDPGIDGHFRFLEGYSTDDVPEVFSISDGKVNSDTLSNRSHGSKPASLAGTLPGVRESFPEDKYKWNDTEPNVTKKPTKTNKRKIFLIVFITLLVLALLGVGLAVILVYTVFDVEEAEEISTIRPEVLCLEGSLDLKENWTDELTNPKSSLYISTAKNFTLEMDIVMKNSSYSESYIRTEVLGFSPGSIAVRFKMYHDHRYKKTGRTAPQFAGLVKEHLIRTAPQTNLAIDSKTIEIHEIPCVPPSTTPDGLPQESTAAQPEMITTAKYSLDTFSPLAVPPTTEFLQPSEITSLTPSVSIYLTESSISTFLQSDDILETTSEDLTRAAYQISPSPTESRAQSLTSIDTSVHVLAPLGSNSSAISITSSEENRRGYDTSLNSSSLETNQNISIFSLFHTLEPTKVEQNILKSRESEQKIGNNSLPSSVFEVQSNNMSELDSSFTNNATIANVSKLISPSRPVDVRSNNTSLTDSNVSLSVEVPGTSTVTVTVTSTVFYLPEQDQKLECTAASDMTKSEIPIVPLQTTHHSNLKMPKSEYKSEILNSLLDDYPVKTQIIHQGKKELSTSEEQSIVTKSNGQLFSQISTIMSRVFSETQNVDTSTSASKSLKNDFFRSKLSDISQSGRDSSFSSVLSTETIYVTPTALRQSISINSSTSTFSVTDDSLSSAINLQEMSVSTHIERISAVHTNVSILQSSKDLKSSDTVFEDDEAMSSLESSSLDSFSTSASSLSTEITTISFSSDDVITQNRTSLNISYSNQTNLNTHVHNIDMPSASSLDVSEAAEDEDNTSLEYDEHNINETYWHKENVTETPYYESLSSRIFSSLYRFAMNTLSTRDNKAESTSKSSSTSPLETFKHNADQNSTIETTTSTKPTIVTSTSSSVKTESTTPSTSTRKVTSPTTKSSTTISTKSSSTSSSSSVSITTPSATQNTTQSTNATAATTSKTTPNTTSTLTSTASTTSISNTSAKSTTTRKTTATTSNQTKSTLLQTTTTTPPPTTTSTSTTTTTPSTTTTQSTTTSTTTTKTPSTTTTESTSTSTTTKTTPSTATSITTPSTTSKTTPTSTTSKTTPSTSKTTPSTTPSTTTTTPTTTTTSKTTTTTAQDRHPIADAGPDITISLPRNNIRVDGSRSTDDHGITSYLWEKISPASLNVIMTGADTSVLSLYDLLEGVYVFRLTVFDKAGHRDRDTVTITVNPAPTTTSTTSTSTTTQPDLCMETRFDECKGRGFIQTTFPNFFNHYSMPEAEEAFNISVQPVKNQICQDTAITYMCSIFFPKCDPKSGQLILPCKDLCFAAINTCGNYFSNPFPCQYFPESDCVAIPTTTMAPTTTTQKPGKCDDTLIEPCRRIGFTKTMFPNFFSETDQIGANATFQGYLKPVIDSGCHEDALFFVCSIQFPKCNAGVNRMPCRRTCEAVTNACVDISMFFQCSMFDELDCLAPFKPSANCTAKEFTCGKVTKCIREDKVCNGIDDCGDWTDEMNCVCNEYEFHCDMGMCIKSYQRCDGIIQCPDNSDEKECSNCRNGELKCPSGECIMAEWKCDGRRECKDGWDEFDCDVCGLNQLTCGDKGHTCVDLAKKCDGVQDCPEGRDEWDCINHEKDILEIAYQKFFIPLCATSWNDDYGPYTCSNLLGEGAYINSTGIPYNVHVFLEFSQSSSTQSVLGPIDLTYSCPDSKGVRVNCEPRGCGKMMVESLVPNVVGGDDSHPGEWPWHVALYFSGQYFCGGTLISDTFVLTAAHCVEKFIRDFSYLKVKLGANNRESSETTQRVVKVEAIESHSDHVYFKKNDIALLQLEQPVTFTDYIQPICLPEPDEPLPLFSQCYTIGWGKTKWDGDYAEVLQKLKMTLWDTKKCNSSVAWNGEIYDTFLCAGYYSGVRSICKGDSGGPLLCRDKYNLWKIIGVSSYVANFCNKTEKPNIYSNVSHFLPWIHEKMECKFRCDNGKCLYYTDQLCDKVDHCGDNSDEIRPCNRTVSCDFEDKYLCGYEFTGWKLGYDNKQATTFELDGQTHTKSNAPQYDHTIGRFPGKFLYGKQKDVREANISSPRFNTTGQSCIRFAYHQRGSIKLGLEVKLYNYRRGAPDDIYDEKRVWSSPLSKNSLDEWKTGYFDVTLGEFKLNFWTGDLLSAAVDDVLMIPGMCSDVLCKDDEFRCRFHKDRCIPKELHCNLAVDCDNAVDENDCSQGTSEYQCTFDNGNLCSLYQEVGDASDWWLVNASFVQEELADRQFVDHTTKSADGFLFYINAYSLQTSANHIYMWQLFALRSTAYCFSFYYQMKSQVNFKIHVNCQGCEMKTYMAQSTFDDRWTLFQVDLPVAEVVNVTYDVEGTQRSESLFRSYLALDDIVVKPGVCPTYVCPPNYTKCRSYDRCIPRSALCDRKVDCMDESDEEQCVCTDDEYRCQSGRCIPQAYKCDRQHQCRDFSDEGDVCQSFLSVSCNFEHPYICGYDYLFYTNFKWERHKGQTLTHFTGPEYDHTYRNESGYYMYTEANNGRPGDNASLISPVFTTSVGHSVLFYYHMLSLEQKYARPGILQFAIENMQTQTKSVEWQAQVLDLKDEWRPVCIDLPDNAKIRLWFTVIRNETTIYGVDMAIDDVRLNTYTCAELTTPPPTTTVPTTARTTTISDGNTCAGGKFRCDEGTCVPQSYRCDGEDDCPDKSDEKNC